MGKSIRGFHRFVLSLGALLALAGCAAPEMDRGSEGLAGNPANDGLWREIASLSLQNQNAERILQEKDKEVVQGKERNVQLIREVETLKWEIHQLRNERTARGETAEHPFLAMQVEEKEEAAKVRPPETVIPKLDEKEIDAQLRFLKATSSKAREELLNDLAYLKAGQKTQQKMIEERNGLIAHYVLQEAGLRKEIDNLKRQRQFMQSEVVTAKKEISPAADSPPSPRSGEIREETLPPVQAKVEAATAAAQEAAGQVVIRQPEAVPKEPSPAAEAGRPKTPAPQAPAGEKGPAKMKILSGDGKIASAQKMAAQLKQLGYKVDRVEIGTRAKIIGPTVYFAAEYLGEAQDLARRLGKKAVLKPLTWPSDFDLIVMTGK